MLVQLIVGVPLEMVHGSCRIALVYMAGVLAGKIVCTDYIIFVFLVARNPTLHWGLQGSNTKISGESGVKLLTLKLINRHKVPALHVQIYGGGGGGLLGV